MSVPRLQTEELPFQDYAIMCLSGDRHSRCEIAPREITTGFYVVAPDQFTVREQHQIRSFSLGATTG